MTNEELVIKIRNGYSVTNNMQKLYENNLPLITMYIKKYSVYEPMEDLLQEAYFGLWDAVQHYESVENVLFMTYASYWIKQAVVRYIEKCGSVVRIPSYAKQRIIRYKKIVDKLTQEQGKTPADKEVAEYMKIPLQTVEEIKVYMQDISSLDMPFGEDNDLTLCDNVQDDFNLENTVIDNLYDEYSKSELWGIVEHYTDDRECDVIKNYFLYNKTMPQIAKEYGLTTERIRIIKNNGLRRLKAGRAKRELLEKFDVLDASMYRSGFGKFKNNGDSTVEYIAIRREQLQQEYEKRIKAMSETKERKCI